MAAAIDRTATGASFARNPAPNAAAGAPAAAPAPVFGDEAGPATPDDPLGIARAATAPLPTDGTRTPLDVNTDVPEVLSTALARRAELLLLLARERDQTQQAKLDAMRSNFDNASAERTEQLREMNALRDMAIEQMKKDDDVLKKFITMI